MQCRACMLMNARLIKLSNFYKLTIVWYLCQFISHLPMLLFIFMCTITSRSSNPFCLVTWRTPPISSCLKNGSRPPVIFTVVDLITSLSRVDTLTAPF
jgi:hypothetical protein